MNPKSNVQFNHFMDMLIGLPEHIQDSLNIDLKHYDKITDVPDNPLPDPPYDTPFPPPPITIVSFNRTDATVEFRFDKAGDLVDVMLSGNRIVEQAKHAATPDVL